MRQPRDRYVIKIQSKKVTISRDYFEFPRVKQFATITFS